MSAEAPDGAFEALLDFLKGSRGLDLTGYKRASLGRRFRRRMDALEIGSFDEYLDYLEVHPDEYAALFDYLLINVTEFFRDPPVWDHLREAVLPAMFEGKEADAPVRVWSAGCASGQEAYTAAMVLAELLGVERFRRQVKIYATDVDEEALSAARLGTYSPADVDSVPPELRDRYFERVENRFSFRKDLRRAVIFGRNNLVADAPISRLDILFCRNTLMYFNAETQARILRHFNFALHDGGVIVLGKSEMMLSNRELFAPVDLNRRIFRRRPAPGMTARVAALTNGDTVEGDDLGAREAALDLTPDAQVVVSPSGGLLFANRAARALFGVGAESIGRPLDALALSQRPVPVRAAVEEALRERHTVQLGEIAFAPDGGGERQLDVTVSPLGPQGHPPIGVAVSYVDVTSYTTLRSELESNRRDLELAYEELQSTIDELETTNEELQSANEELQTTNEELQSTNEELETMNEELHSTNEELETINDELRDRTAELNRVNDFLEAILASLGVGVAVLDARQAVQVWNRRAEDLWGLRSEEVVDRHFLSLDIGLPTEQLAPALRAVLVDGEAQRLEVEAVNRRGRRIMCSVSVLPLVAPGVPAPPPAAIVLMDDRPPAREGHRAP